MFAYSLTMLLIDKPTRQPTNRGKT